MPYQANPERYTANHPASPILLNRARPMDRPRMRSRVDLIRTPRLWWRFLLGIEGIRQPLNLLPRIPVPNMRRKMRPNRIRRHQLRMRARRHAAILPDIAVMKLNVQHTGAARIMAYGFYVFGFYGGTVHGLPLLRRRATYCACLCAPVIGTGLRTPFHFWLQVGQRSVMNSTSDRSRRSEMPGMPQHAQRTPP